ncbi:Ulp1 protease family, C-terminal catalytic domain containing protein [Parasponia andersonii]|uniref:Ulp1 protease family, C-terminal catalytic domain containing protein n=1 Tax=Parasponia andersonii TaxID=3476 RepID=A0A2P5D6N2_PARAD|nr:Ulp1 protease family, C-terminal catalytic domain containing protein [Parasponia andersonii]
MFKDSDLEQFLELFRWMIQYMMHQSNKFERYSNKMPELFICQRRHDIPQNHGSRDCEIYAIKHIEFHMTNKSLNNVNNDNIAFFKEKMACEIYNND